MNHLSHSLVFERLFSTSGNDGTYKKLNYNVLIFPCCLWRRAPKRLREVSVKNDNWSLCGVIRQQDMFCHFRSRAVGRFARCQAQRAFLFLFLREKKKNTKKGIPLIDWIPGPSPRMTRQKTGFPPEFTPPHLIRSGKRESQQTLF